MSQRRYCDVPPLRRSLKKLVDGPKVCITLLCNMGAMLTIRLDKNLQTLLDQACSLAGRTRSDLARDALRRQLTLAAFEELRRAAMCEASAAGFHTDEDVFDVVS